MKYSAVYGPNSERSKSGFDNHDEVIKYIGTQICEGCKKLVIAGFDVLDYVDEDGDIILDKREVSDAMDTSCGAEWFIVEDTDFEEYRENKDFKFLLDSAGYKIVERDSNKSKSVEGTND